MKKRKEIDVKDAIIIEPNYTGERVIISDGKTIKSYPAEWVTIEPDLPGESAGIPLSAQTEKE